MIPQHILLLCSLLVCVITKAQTDIARVEYTYFPQRNSDNSFRRFRTFVNIPLKINDKGSYLVPGIEYRNVNFKYRDETSFSTENLERFGSFELRLGYTFKLKNDWRYAMQFGVRAASNFEDTKLISEDILYIGSVYFIKNKTKAYRSKPWRLIVGLRYSTAAGVPLPLPFVNYYREFHPSWSFSLGIPKSNLKYAFNKKNIVQSFVTLDGFFANIQNNRIVTDVETATEEIANNISMTIALAGFGYEYLFTDHFLFYTYAGFTVLNDIRLRNNDREDILTINDSNSAYIRAGLKLKI